MARDELSVHSDVTSKDGIRVIRLTYKRLEESTFSFSEDPTAEKVSYFISTVFDKTGKLIDVHSEHAIESGL